MVSKLLPVDTCTQKSVCVVSKMSYFHPRPAVTVRKLGHVTRDGCSCFQGNSQQGMLNRRQAFKCRIQKESWSRYKQMITLSMSHTEPANIIMVMQWLRYTSKHWTPVSIFVQIRTNGSHSWPIFTLWLRQKLITDSLHHRLHGMFLQSTVALLLSVNIEFFRHNFQFVIRYYLVSTVMKNPEKFWEINFLSP